MFDMFGWLDMIDDYESRNVANYGNEVFTIDTSLVTDRDMPYETAIQHRDFRDNEWIILGWTDTIESAQRFHDDMVKYYIENGDSITSIKDVYENCEYARM